ncbi:Protein of unknown function [Nitrosomonas marina]|uniref:Uncharacterized protein n=1 Tax=Nitrosomonas marina TaxID=917 RepID=A0A1I0EGG9_9PROT|nr:DUF2958 domain-containing protein [Nitrosomonas marina]SET44351.1 Protein of unknown function [Nitrosomonas marina]
MEQNSIVYDAAGGVYLDLDKNAVSATADLLKYFRDFIRSDATTAQVPQDLMGFAGGRMTMNKESAQQILRRLIDVAVNRKAGIPDATQEQRQRLADFAHDARVINDYFTKRARSSGSRNLLRTPEMKKKYPYIDNQPAEFDSVTDTMLIFDAISGAEKLRHVRELGSLRMAMEAAKSGMEKLGLVKRIKEIRELLGVAAKNVDGDDGPEETKTTPSGSGFESAVSNIKTNFIQTGVISESVPDGWVLMNAPRPIMGTKTFQDEFIHGRFYAAIDPTDEFAESNAKNNDSLDAWIIIQQPKEVLDTMVENAIPERLRERYMELEPDVRKQYLDQKISDLNGKPYSEALSMLNKALNSGEKGKEADPQPEPQPEAKSTLADVNAVMPILKQFIGKSQLAAFASGIRGEEGQFIKDKLIEIANIIKNMPQTYGQDGLGDEAVVHLHYFKGSADWYITEKDMEDEQLQAFGLADLYGDGGELGYISIQELIDSGVELDFYWTPKTVGDIKNSGSTDDQESGDMYKDIQRTVVNDLNGDGNKDTDSARAFLQSVINGTADMDSEEFAEQIEQAANRLGESDELVIQAANAYGEYVARKSRELLQ